MNLESHFAGTPVFFAGYLAGRALAEAMASVDALILPSKTETLGLVLMEGMAAGTIVIGANAGGIPDVIEHETNGFLFEPDREGDLARIARRLVTEPAVCETLRANARRHAEGWNWAASTRRLLEFYESATHMPRFEKPARANAPWMLAMKRAAVGGMKIFLS
jgi:glycosyltransferase involved in cell wall biosynthesis